MAEELNLRIVGVEPGELIAGARRVMINTTRGVIPTVLHAAPQPGRVALCLSGAIGGLDGPSALYPRLGAIMPAAGISVMRLDYRMSNDFSECLLDAMAGLAFLKGIGHRHAALLGHSFGGAVAINAGTISPMVATVVAISSQLAGAHVVGNLAPKPLLLIHGTADTILSHESSQALYERAGEPKTIRLFPGAGHRLGEVAEQLVAEVQTWLGAKLNLA